MDDSLLMSWLDLPAGPWPPDHYTLLALPPGRCDAAQIESRVLERMDRLRSHQILHPEIVTEGMNRLAQALITLTDPQSKAAYDRELASGVRKPAVAEQRVQESPKQQGAYAPRSPVEEAVVVAAPVFDDDIFSDDARLPGPVDAGEATRIVEWNPDAAFPEHASATATFEVLPGDRPPPAPASYEVAREERAEPPAKEPAPPGLDSAALATATDWLATRRRLYARLALIRKARTAWQALGPILGNPDDPVDRPVRVLILLEAVGMLRPLLPGLSGLVGGIGEPGGLVGAVARQPLVLDTFRRLLPPQRTALAIDWKQAQERLDKEYARLRQLLQRDRERRAGARSGLVFLRWLAASPEVLLAVLAALLLVAALLRAVMGR